MKIQKNYFLIILMILMSAVLCSCSRKSTGSGILQNRMGSGTKMGEAVSVEQQEEFSTEEGADAESDLYIILKIDTEQKQAVFQKVSNGRQTQYVYDTGTRFLDKYENTKSAASFLPGDAVELEVLKSSEKLLSVRLSDEVWVYDDIINYSIDQEAGAITIGGTRYSCNSDMDIFSGEGTIDFTGIGEEDVLRAVGIGKKIISLAVAKGHGYLALANTKLFEGSFICVGDRIFEEVAKDMKIEVPEGTYLVTVANNGYGGSREITIERDTTTSLNLEELKGEGPKICKAVFRVGVEGAKLFIDGKKADYSAPIELSYGVHTIAVEAEGYDTITKTLVVNSKSAELEIALSESSGNGDSKDEDNNNNGSDTNTNAANTNNNANNNTNNNSNANNTNNNDNNGSSTDTNNNNASQTDYLTTLYNLLTSINNTNSSNNNSGSTGDNSNAGDSYDDLRDQ